MGEFEIWDFARIKMSKKSHSLKRENIALINCLSNST